MDFAIGFMLIVTSRKGLFSVYSLKRCSDEGIVISVF
jgi:hypothetical protein